MFVSLCEVAAASPTHSCWRAGSCSLCIFSFPLERKRKPTKLEGYSTPDLGRSALFFQVSRGFSQEVRIIPELSKARIASAAKQTAYCSSGVVVIDSQCNGVPCFGHSTHRTRTILLVVLCYVGIRCYLCTPACGSPCVPGAPSLSRLLLLVVFLPRPRYLCKRRPILPHPPIFAILALIGVAISTARICTEE
jgi:hypothetical protein